MAMSVGQDRSNVIVPGVILGTAGMSAYFCLLQKTDLYVLHSIFKKS